MIRKTMFFFAIVMALLAAPLFAADDKPRDARVAVAADGANDDRNLKKGDDDADMGDMEEARKLLREAGQVLDASLSAPDKGIPKDLLEKAECVGVFPGVKKGAFVVGGEFGRGVFTCRQANGRMGAPAFFAMGGPSVGWQFGGQEADIVLLIMNKDGMEHLLKDKFTIGGEASASAGPVGRTAQAGTDAQLRAQILSWSRSRGAFVGASLEGSVVRHSEKWNRKFYGKERPASEILRDSSVPRDAEPYVRSLDKHAEREPR